MTAIIIDGRVRVTFATAISNIALPTAAELNAGTALEGLITPDGLDISFDTGGVDVGTLASTCTTMRAGRRKPAMSITFHADSPVDTAWNLFPYRTNGFIVVRRRIDRTTAWTSGQPVRVYPVEAGEANESKPAPDSTDDFTIPFFITTDPNTRAVVA